MVKITQESFTSAPIPFERNHHSGGA